MDKSVEKLRADSVEHLRYEIWMMQETTQRLRHGNALHKDAVLKNAVVESCIVHARSLTAFIYPDNAHTDDITSDDYVTDKPTWAKARGAIPPILVTLNIRTSKEIAHLTTKRLGADDPRKPWPLQEIVATLHALLKQFGAHAASDRLDPEVSRFIAGLRPPIETATSAVYNPLSTEVETKLKFPTDVSTTAPLIRWPKSSA
jgi:hypothetical protein